VADLELLRPVLAKLVESGPDLVNSLSLLPTFPFSDGTVDAFAGDYSNLYVELDLDLSSLLENLARSGEPFPGPDGTLGMLPPTSQLLGPLLGPESPSLPSFPLLGQGDLLPLPGEVEPTPTSGSPEPPDEDAEPTRDGGLLGGLLGGGR
jgi:phospholipid/cholesterol/gamma-HCH transport system substrate-binding protein